MKIKVRGASESITTAGIQLIKDTISSIDSISSVSELLSRAKSKSQLQSSLRGVLPYSWIPYPVFEDMRDDMVITLFFTIDGNTGDIILEKPYLANLQHAASRSILGIVDNILTDLASKFDSGKYYNWTIDDMTSAISLVDGQAAVVGKSSAEIDKIFNGNVQLYATEASLVQLKDEYIELLLDECKEALKKTLEIYLQTLESDTTTSSNTSSAPSSLTIPKAIDFMVNTGGTVTVDGHKGLLLQVYYDYRSGKYRVRTNDGVNGLGNVSFPNSARYQDAVYIIPSSYVSWNGKNYRVSNTPYLESWRIR